MDIMELIEEYGKAKSEYTSSVILYASDQNERQKYKNDLLLKLKSRISTMQEVCNAAIKCKGLGMNPDLYDAVAKLEALK